MNASLPAALLLVLLASTWLLGRRRARPFLRSTDTSDVVALNRAQIERLREQPPIVTSDASSPSLPTALESPVPAPPRPAGMVIPRDPRRRRECLRQLEAWLVGSREQRLQAMAIARQCDQRWVLPLLRRGLRDPDPAVMASAASGMARFRGRSTPLDGPSATPVSQSRQRPAQIGMPRSVLRTR